MTPLLEAWDVSKHYDGVRALRGAKFALARGEVHAVMGENGAGKSTLAKILAGSVRPDSGRFAIEGRSVSIADPREAQRLGIGIIYQELDLFPNLTVGENLVIGNLRYREGSLVDFSSMERFCRPYLELAGLAAGVRRSVSTLAIAERQLLAIARALSMEARIILMDEPTSSLFDDAVERLFRLIADLKPRGVSIVYVSHKMNEIFRISDRVTVMRDGETVQTLETASTTAEEIIRLMVGRDLVAGARAPRPNNGQVALAVRGLTTDKIRDISFDLRYGEVLGVAGLVGSGRSELLGALFGIERVRAGAVEPALPRSPRDAIRQKVGMLPEDRRAQGLMMQMSVRENMTIAALSRFARLGWVCGALERAQLESPVRRLALRCASTEAPVETLSGGNQQKALLARWLLLEPKVLLLDDPTRGIDVGAKLDIYRIIDELAAAGAAILLVSSELSELLRCSDRIAVLSGGRLTAVYQAGEATQERIMASATELRA